MCVFAHQRHDLVLQGVPTATGSLRLTRRSMAVTGFRSQHAVIALAVLSLGVLCASYQDGETPHGCIIRIRVR
jgi:aspartyl-tRNA synthetase